MKPTKVKADVEKRGIGEKSRVKVELVNGTEAKGYVSKVDNASFEVPDKKTTQTTTIRYAEVKKIRGPGLSKGATIAIVAGVGVVVVAVVIAVGLSTARHGLKNTSI